MVARPEHAADDSDELSGTASSFQHAAGASEGHVKGRLLVHLEKFAIGHHGEGVWQRALQDLSPECHRVFHEPVLGNAWYPVCVWNCALNAYMKNFVNTSAAMANLAHMVASEDLNILFKLLIRAGSAELVLARSESLYRRYFDCGVFTASKVKSRVWHCELSASANERSSPGHLTCSEGISEWLRRALELTSTRAKVEHARCRFRGAPSCAYDITW